MRAAPGVAIVCAAIVASPAWAQPDVRLSTQLSTRRVEVMQPFQLQLTALVASGSGEPTSPRL